MKVTGIEEQLKEIWNGFARHHPDQPVTRARVMNLVVYSPRSEKESDVSQVLSDVAANSPGRIIILHRNSDAELSSWVNALCHLSSGGRRQVCSEQIVLRGPKESPIRWSSAVLPLLVPDLPVFLWWNESTRENMELLKALTESVDRLIVDTSFAEGDHLSVLPLMEEQGDWLSISDLNWARLTPWRIAIAGLYDHPECRACLESIVRLEIECESEFQESWHAKLFSAWIASALNWKWAAKPNFINSSQSMVIVETRIAKAARDRLLRVRLLSKRSEFLVTCENHYLRSEIFIEGKSRGSQVIQTPAESMSALLGKELTILGHDRIYEKAIRFLG